MSGFDYLHPALQYHIVNSLGWRSLRPLQETSVEPILSGATTLLSAPTAGGKTEAAAFPLFSRMLDEEWHPLSVLYVCPLKALINDLETRLSRYAMLLGRTAELWHGDLSAGDRRRIRREPPDLLLTTPESIEVMLISQAAGRGSLFRNLRAVVVDELHAFAGDDRGWHLLAVLERAARIAGRPIQRVGLSATIGNPEELTQWLAGSSDADTRVVSALPRNLDGGASRTEREDEAAVQIDFGGSLENAAIVISRLHRGEKRLVFCDSRARVENLAFQLRKHGVQTFASHGSLGVEERHAAERAFVEAHDCVIVATSALELGIDVGDLDRVLQIDAPGTVASFLQRFGRTGRRPETKRILLFLATDEDGLLQAGAIVRLWRQGFVEPLDPPTAPFTVLAQQLLTLTIQQQGLGRAGWRSWIGGVPGFARMSEGAVETVVDYMLDQGFLFSDSGVLGLGPEGERHFTGKAFLDLLSVFSTDPLFTVLHGQTEIGRVAEASFLRSGDHGPGGRILLGGRSWFVRHIEWNDRIAYVEPDSEEEQGRSLWPGSGPPLAFEICDSMRRVLTEDDLPDNHLTRRAQNALNNLRERLAWLPPSGTAMVRETNSRTRWWTFGGLRANATIGDFLGERAVPVLSRDNLALVLEVPPGDANLQGALESARCGEVLLEPTSLPIKAAESMKFHFLVPPPLLLGCLRQRLSDAEGTRCVLEGPLLAL